MKTFKEFVENIMPTRDPNYGLNVTADVAQDENDASVFVLPLLHKLRTFKDYLNVVAESIYTSLRRVDMDSDYPEIKNNSRLMHMLRVPFRAHDGLDFDNLPTIDNSFSVMEYLNRLTECIESAHYIMELFITGKINITWNGVEIESKQQLVNIYIEIIDEAISLPIDMINPLNPKTQAAIKRIVKFLESTKEPIRMIGHHFDRQKNFKKTTPKKDIRHRNI